MLDNKYIYLQDEGDKYWIELDRENYAVRQISMDTCGRYHLSCFEDCMAEGVFEEKNPEVYETAFELYEESVINGSGENPAIAFHEEYNRLYKEFLMQLFDELFI